MYSLISLKFEKYYVLKNHNSLNGRCYCSHLDRSYLCLILPPVLTLMTNYILHIVLEIANTRWYTA